MSAAAKSRRLRSRELSLPRLPVGDPGPRAAGRGPLALETVLVESHDRDADAASMVPAVVVRSMVDHGFRALSHEHQATARRYAGWVERQASPGSPGPSGSGGISDGGAVSRCEIAERVRRAHPAIGSDLEGLMAKGHSDRGHGRPLLVLELVNAVCLEGRSIRSTVRAAGWPTTNGNLAAAGKALRAAMARLQRVVG